MEHGRISSLPELKRVSEELRVMFLALVILFGFMVLGVICIIYIRTNIIITMFWSQCLPDVC